MHRPSSAVINTNRAVARTTLRCTVICRETSQICLRSLIIRARMLVLLAHSTIIKRSTMRNDRQIIKCQAASTQVKCWTWVESIRKLSTNTCNIKESKIKLQRSHRSTGSMRKHKITACCNTQMPCKLCDLKTSMDRNDKVIKIFIDFNSDKLVKVQSSNCT